MARLPRSPDEPKIKRVDMALPEACLVDGVQWNWAVRQGGFAQSSDPDESASNGAMPKSPFISSIILDNS